MKTHSFIFIFILLSVFAQAQNDNNTSSEDGCIAIRQSFYGNGKKNPKFSESDIYVDKEKHQSIGKISSLNETISFKVNNCNYNNYNTIYIKSKIEIGNKNENENISFNIGDLTPGGVEKITNSTSVPYIKWGWLNDLVGGEYSYTLCTYIIYDIPVKIEYWNDQDAQNGFNIDNHECLELKFGNFYANGSPAKLQYRVADCDTENEWHDCENVQVTPKGTVFISYKSLFGNDMGNLNKNIDFQVEKELLNGTLTYSNEVHCKFIQSAPDYEITDVTTTACGIKFKIRVKNNLEKFNEIINEDKFEWILNYDPDNDGEHGTPLFEGALKNYFKSSTDDPSVFIFDLPPISDLTYDNKNIKGSFSLSMDLNNTQFKGLYLNNSDNSKKTFTIKDPIKDPVKVTQKGPKDDGNSALFYSSIIDDNNKVAVIDITNAYGKFNYKVNDENNNECQIHSPISITYELLMAGKDIMTLSEYKEKYPLDNNPRIKEYGDEQMIENKWKKFYEEKYEKWFEGYCEPKTIESKDLKTCPRANWGGHKIDGFPLLMVFDEDEGNAYFAWTMLGTWVSAFTIKNVPDNFINDWYNNYVSNHHEIKDISYGKKICLKSGKSFGLKEMSMTFIGDNLDVKTYYLDNETNKDASKTFDFYAKSMKYSYEYVAHHGCQTVVKEDDKYYIMHVCGESSHFYHNTYVCCLDELDDFDDFDFGIFDTEGNWVYYADGKIQKRRGKVYLEKRYIEKIWYASSDIIQYEYKDGTLEQKFIGESATPPNSKVKEWKDEFYNQQYKIYESYEGYEFPIHNYNTLETYKLIDSDGCESTFNVVVYAATFEKDSHKSPEEWGSTDGNIVLKYTNGPKIKYGDASYSPSPTTTITVDGLGDSGNINFDVVENNKNVGIITYHYNIGNKINNVYASYCEGNNSGRIKVEVKDSKKIGKKFKLYGINNNNVETELDEYTQTTNDNCYTFVIDKPEYESYRVRVSKSDNDNVVAEWPHKIKLKENPFKFTSVSYNDAKEINGKGDASVKLANTAGFTVKWKFDNSDDKDNINSELSAINPGEHNIKATLENYCTIEKDIPINEPLINYSLEIEQSNGIFTVTPITNQTNQIAGGSLKLLSQGQEITNFLEKPLPLPNSGNTQTYSLVFKPYNGTQWEIKSFTMPLTTLSTEHELNYLQDCPEQKMKVSINNVPNHNISLIYNNNEYSPGTSFEVDKGVTKLQYAVKDFSEEKLPNGKSSVTIKYGKKQQYDKDLPLLSVFTGNFYIDDFHCNKDEETTLHITELNGGADDKTVEYSFDNNLWFSNLTCEDNEYSIKIINKSENITSAKDYYYTLYLRDSKHNCQSQQFGSQQKTTRPSELSVEFINNGIVHPTCEGTPSGSVMVKATGGTMLGNYTGYCYFVDETEDNAKATIINDGYSGHMLRADAVKTFENLYAGDHIVSVYDNNLCKAEITGHLLSYYNPRVISATDDWAKCYGYSDGSINVDEIKGTSSIKQFQLLDVRGDTLQILNANDELLQNAINTDDENDFEWDIKNQKGERIPFISFGSLKSGYYNLALTDEKGCSTNYTGLTDNQWLNVYVHQPDSLIMSIIHQDTIIREYGKPGGSVNVNVSGGNKGTFNIYLDSKEDTLTQVIWGNHAFNDIFTPGTHKLYVTDHKECIDSATTKQMRQPDSPLSIEATPHDALCNGSFGSITVRGSGGWNGYQYSCSSKSNLYGANQNEYTFYDIKGGYYEVSVTDAEGVTATQKVYVNTPPKLMAVPQLRASSCKNDGLISANITGGTMPYLVKPDSSSVTPFYFEPYITNSNLTIIPKQLAAGDYSIVVVDSNNCEILMSATIADSSVKATVKPVYPTAHEFANGRLEAVVQQGPAPYTYLWKNHNTGETSTSAVWDKVGAGVYSLEVTDANNCSVSVPITYLATNGDLPLIIDTIIGETAVGACNGMAKFTSDTTGFKSITLHGNSGVEKDVTSLVNNKLQFELTGLAPDSYLLECVLADTTVRYAKFTIARYEPMHLIVSNIVDVSKQDAANGSAKLRIDGGRAPFIVQMLRGDDFLADTVLNDRNLPMSGLTAANYTVSVVDESDNRINTQFIIRKPEKPLRLQAQSVENPSCNGYTNGRIILKATGGWGDYEYAAAEGEFGRATAYDGRGAAVHTFVAIDSKGITDTLKVELVEPLPLTARVVQVDSVSCFGLPDGSVTFDIAGGTAPYTVHYDDFFDKKSNFVGSLNAGTHTFNITDSNFCRAVEGSLAVDIPQPDVLQVASDSVIHTTCNTDNGRIFITIAGGTAPYANSWREDGLIKERFANLTAIDSLQGYSLYEVEVADAKGCKTGKSYRINPSSGPKIERVRTLPVLCHGDSTGTAIIDSADIVPATPYSPFRIEWPHGENAMSVGNLPAGWNVVFVIDSNNCKSGTGFNVDAPSPVEIRKIGSRDASCYGYADGRISTLTLGGVGGYRYQWSNGDTLPDIDSIAKGAYTIVVADRNNCRDSAVFAIGQPDSLHVEIGEENVLMCPDNTYEFIPTDGFKTYRWILNDSTLSDKRNLIASEQGEYHLVATYGANCISRDTVTITIGDDLLEADFYMASDASKDNTIALVELSNMKTDSIRWDFSATDFEVMDSSLYELQLKPNTIGRHNITLWAYSSGCVSYITKQVEISELPDTTDNIKLGYDPLIKSVTVKPNPTNGLFRVDVQLRESHDAEMTISSVSHGTQIEQRELTGEAEYSESFDLSNASDGVYILRISASDEHRVMKVLIAK